MRSKSRPDEDPTWSKHVAEWILCTVVFGGCLFISCYKERDTCGARDVYWERGNACGLEVVKCERNGP